jgi:hypothetical protein
MSNDKKQTVVQLIIQALDIECKSRGMNVYWDMYLEMEKEQTKITENTSDGYHTFKDLYAIRKAYNVALFNDWAKMHEVLNPYGGEIGDGFIKDWDNAKPYLNGGFLPKHFVHKSKKHHDGEYPFGKDNWFIVSALLPSGQISNHYPMEDWDLFKIPETEKALFEFDGHTTQDVIDRLLDLENKVRHLELHMQRLSNDKQ